MVTSTSPTISTTQNEYIPRGRNVLHTIFENHFQDFVDHYEEKYEKDYGKYRLDRIISIVKNFLDCGDYIKGIARIRCVNPNCGFDYFVPFSCKGFYLCPSCSQKRTLLFSENMVNDVLLLLPHRQYVFAIPKCLRVFFKHDRKLFGEVSRLIFQMIQSFYNEAVGKTIRTASVISFQTAGDFLRFNSHYHGIVLEGGFDEEGNFVFIPFGNLDKMSEYFRRMIIKFFLDRKLINEQFAQNLLTWRHSGFSINNEIRIYGSDEKARENLSQYIARPPISLKKVFYEPFKSKVLFKTKYNDYFKENVKMFDAEDFIADLTLHIPPKNVQYIRRYGLYASRTRGIWISMPEVVARAPQGWKNEHLNNVGIEAEDGKEDRDISLSEKERRSAWARLLAKVYEVHPFTCPKCQSDMSIIAVIMDPEEINKILQHLVKVGRSPPGINTTSLN